MGIPLLLVGDTLIHGAAQRPLPGDHTVSALHDRNQTTIPTTFETAGFKLPQIASLTKRTFFATSLKFRAHHTRYSRGKIDERDCCCRNRSALHIPEYLTPPGQIQTGILQVAAVENFDSNHLVRPFGPAFETTDIAPWGA